MDCEEARERILNSLAEARPVGPSVDLSTHLSGCPTCRSFSEIQLMLDRQLTNLISEPAPAKEFRGALLKRVKREPLAVWAEFLPDLAHAIGCLVATTVCIVLLPIPAGLATLVGSALALSAYFVQTVFQGFLETWEEEQS